MILFDVQNLENTQGKSRYNQRELRLRVLNRLHRNLRDLTLSMRLLKKFPNLVALSLHGNSLKMLPLMTNLQLTHLDISKNPLEIDSYLLDSLYSLTTLEHLKIDGSDKDLDRIVENLPTLKTLNGHKVIRERRI